MATRIIRDEITGIDGTTATIEITIPDQGTASIHGDLGEVYVESTSRKRTYRVRLTRRGPVSCECEYHARNPRRWRDAPCVHVRAAQAALAERVRLGKRNGAQLREFLTGLGWSPARFDAEVRRAMRCAGGDPYTAAQFVQSWNGVRAVAA